MSGRIDRGSTVKQKLSEARQRVFTENNLHGIATVGTVAAAFGLGPIAPGIALASLAGYRLIAKRGVITGMKNPTAEEQAAQQATAAALQAAKKAEREAQAKENRYKEYVQWENGDSPIQQWWARTQAEQIEFAERLADERRTKARNDRT